MLHKRSGNTAAGRWPEFGVQRSSVCPGIWGKISLQGSSHFRSEKKKKNPQYELFHLRWLSQKQGEFSLYVYHYLPHIHYKTMLRKLRSIKGRVWHLVELTQITSHLPGQGKPEAQNILQRLLWGPRLQLAIWTPGLESQLGHPRQVTTSLSLVFLFYKIGMICQWKTRAGE